MAHAIFFFLFFVYGIDITSLQDNNLIMLMFYRLSVAVLPSFLFP